MLRDLDALLTLADQMGAHDDRNRPYCGVAAELRADAFVSVQHAICALANRVHSARKDDAFDGAILTEGMSVVVALIPFVRAAAYDGAHCDGGFGSLVSAIENVLGSIAMTVRSAIGVVDDAADPAW